MKVIENYMHALWNSGLYPEKFVVHGKQGNIFKVEDPKTNKYYELLTFCTNDVLGLTQSPMVKQATVDAVLQYGTSNSSCSVLSGRIDLHHQLEQEISSLKQLPHTHLFLNAWMALQALMDGFCHLASPVPGFVNNRETLILTDVLNHGCIISAVSNADNRSGKMFSQSPKVRVKAYRHCDMEDLGRKIKRFAKPDDRIVLISDAVFSMDGDIAPLPEMIKILEDYPDSVIVMDEAHASGAIGAQGGGIYEHFGIDTQQVLDKGINPIIMTTFSKFAASAGAAISSFSPELIDLLDVSPTSIGTISLPPPTTAAALESIRQMRQNPHLVAQLQENSSYLRSSLEKAGFEAMGETNVIPVILSESMNPKVFARHLMDNYGIWVSPIWFIAKPRLRITPNALHTKEEMDKLVDAMIATRKSFSSQKSMELTA